MTEAQSISIHALLAESDGFGPARLVACVNFYPRSPCGERLLRRYPAILGNAISIHALLAESDALLRFQSFGFVISIHALLAESDEPTAARNDQDDIFLSTLSLRRATLFALLCNLLHHDFYPRSPCGERRRRSVKLFRQNYISIHALLAESDVSYQYIS